jgi:hypothetical protein
LPFDDGRRARSVEPVGWDRVEAVKVHLKAGVRRAFIAQNRRVLKPVPDCPRTDKIVNVRGAGRGGASGPEGEDLQPGELNM